MTLRQFLNNFLKMSIHVVTFIALTFRTKKAFILHIVLFNLTKNVRNCSMMKKTNINATRAMIC